MESVVGGEGVLVQSPDWLPSFLNIMGGAFEDRNKAGKIAVDLDKVDAALSVIWQNRIKGSPVDTSALTRKNYREFCECCERLKGVREIAFRTGLLETSYMKALADTKGVVLNEQQQKKCLEETKKVLGVCLARGFLKAPAVQNWVEDYCLASYRLNQTTINTR